MKRTRQSRTHFRRKHCSPKKGKLNYSCFTKSSLLKIAKALNKLPNIKVKTTNTTIPQLYGDITKIMKSKFQCNTEACWLTIRKFMKLLSTKEAEMIRSHFRPHMPKELVSDYTKWISNFHIMSFLDQYHTELDDFYSYGATPIDFHKCSVNQDLCKIDIHSHKSNGEYKLGMVFNTDKSGEPGEHWICMFIDLKGINIKEQPAIYYFDSFASPPPQEVTRLIDKLHSQGGKDHFAVFKNDTSFQKNTFSCGFYCMHFLEHMILGNSFEDYLTSGVNDKQIIAYRNHCFLHPSEIK